jgi:hypothetical protein
MRNYLPLVASAALAVLGCAKGGATPQADAKAANDLVAADKAFIAQVNALPPSDRKAFISAHFLQFRHLMSDPDPTVKAAYIQLLKQP